MGRQVTNWRGRRQVAIFVIFSYHVIMLWPIRISICSLVLSTWGRYLISEPFETWLPVEYLKVYTGRVWNVYRNEFHECGDDDLAPLVLRRPLRSAISVILFSSVCHCNVDDVTAVQAKSSHEKVVLVACEETVAFCKDMFCPCVLKTLIFTHILSYSVSVLSRVTTVRTCWW